MGEGGVMRGLGATTAVVAMAMFAAAGCSSSAPAAPPPAPAATEPAAPTQPPAPPPASAPAETPRMDADLCRADALQWLVGQPRTEIPVPVDVINRRVVCTTCPITEDYSPYRLNIFFNQDSGIVEEVRCG